MATPSPNPPPKWPLPVLLGLSLCMFVGAAIFSSESRRLARDGRVAIGEVIDIDDFGSSSGIPRVRFDAQGRSVAVDLANPGGRSFQIGDAVHVRFDPANPELVRFDTFFGVWGQVMIIAGIGVAMLAAAVVFAVLRRRALG